MVGIQTLKVLVPSAAAVCIHAVFVLCMHLIHAVLEEVTLREKGQQSPLWSEKNSPKEVEDEASDHSRSECMDIQYHNLYHSL